MSSLQVRSFAQRSLALVASVAGVLSFVAPTSASADGYRFLLPTVNARAGESVRFTIEGDHEQAAQGFSLAARYPSNDLTITRIHITDTILEAINGQEGVDYFETEISPALGAFTVGVLVDSKPPFDGTLIPAIGRPLAFLHLELQVSASASGDLKIKLEDGLMDPPIDNLYSVDNRAVYVTELTEGTVRLGGGQGAGGGFLRGDFNMDTSLDISDPIGILGYMFFGGASPKCVLAGDANDDETVDVSDSIYLLSYLFAQGPAPPPPSEATGGIDPTPGELPCIQSLQF